MIDTAGIRETEDVVEKIGVGKAKQMAENADLILYVVDSSLPLDDNDREIMELLSGRKSIVIYNKTDLEAAVDIEELKEKTGRTGHTSNIHFIRIKSFWFNKYLMTFFIRKTNDLVLDRWTVSRSGTFNHTGIQWRTVQIITDDLMRFFVCISQPAGLLLDLYRLRIR